MGKAKKSPAKKVDNKQSKISLFFQGSTSSSSKTTSGKQSLLFTSVNQQTKPKSKLSLNKSRSPGTTSDQKNSPSPTKEDAKTTEGFSSTTHGTKEKPIEIRDGGKPKSLFAELGSRNKPTVLKPMDDVPFKETASPMDLEATCDVEKTDEQSAKTKDVLLQASQIIRTLVGGGLGVHTMKTLEEEQITCIPETQLEPFSPPQVTPKSDRHHRDDPTHEDSESDSMLIPDTPQETKNAAAQKRKPFRSFLTSSGSLSSSNTLHQKLKQQDQSKQKLVMGSRAAKQKAKPVGRPLEEALKSVENDLEFASPETFNALVTGVGFGQNPIFTSTESTTSDFQSSSKVKSRPGTVGSLSGVKRSSISGSSPNAKRLMRKTPTKHNMSHTLQSSDSENKKDATKPHKVKKFSKNLSKTFSKNMLVKQDTFPRDTTEKNVHLDGDDDLSDLLKSYQSSASVAPVAAAVTPEQTRTSYTGVKSLNELLKSEPEQMMLYHDEPDDALDDIISELRGTLTQSNSKTKSGQFKAKLERSILSEGVSPRPVQTAKRRIPVDEQGTKYRKNGQPEGLQSANELSNNCDNVHDKENSPSKCSSDHLVRSPSTGSIKSDTNRYISDPASPGSNIEKMQVEEVCSSEMSPKSDALGVTDDLDMSDLQFDEEALQMEENLQRQFNAMSPFKKKPVQKEENRSPNFNSKDTEVPCSRFGRCKVKEVLKQGCDVLLELLTDPGGERRQALLQGFWSDVAVSEGDVVHIVGDFDPAGRVTLSDSKNLLIVHPDLLISGTSVVSGIYCMRKAVLNERFKGYDSKNIHMLYGTIIHSFFQQVVQQRRFSPDALEKVMTSVLQQPRVLHDMYGQGVPREAVVEEITKYIPQLQAWAARYLSANGQRIESASYKKSNNDVTITRIADIEENVWSPRYGVKGKIDLTVEVKIHDRNKGTIKKLMPLELKTGRPTHSIEHKGQVTLYSMMSSDRRTDPEAGLLLYLKDGSMSTVPAGHANQRGLVQLRNELAHHLHQSVTSTEGSGMPRPINNPRSCGKCPQLINCTIYQKVLENNPVDPSHAMSRLVPETLLHLTEQHLDFYARWVRLMMLELGTESTTGGRVADLWCKSGWQREQKGLCLSGMVLSEERIVETETGHFRQVFVRVASHPSDVRLSDVGIGARDNLVVSAENESLIALTMGAVSNVTETTVTMLLDRDLSLVDPSRRLVYRLDKADTYNTMATNMTNLARLMENTDTSARLREIVIEKKTPEFEITMSKGVIEQVKTIFKHLNKPQKTAILKVLMCKDYVLIKGFPGTGKTSTIVSLVRILALLGRSVLLTSYTHSAVDNILLKLIKYDLDFVRLGRAERVHPEVRPFSAELQTLKMKSVEELSEFYESKPVVATTCLGVGSHPLFTRRKFDVCIVDEASQVLQPACLGPLFASSRFVLVGDPLQLPPVVQSHKAREGGMAESLFARLDDTGGTYELNLQYRMNAEIMRLSNELVYSGALQCGSEAVARGRLCLSLPRGLDAEQDWVRTALSEETRVIFLDTCKMPAIEEKNKSDGVQNMTEAHLVHQLVHTCVEGGVDRGEVGVITPYRSQVALITDVLRRHELGDVEVNTVDQYQGRDKNCIIVSFVKQKPGKGGGILEDMRRLNVALTRARHKLVLMGNRTVLATYAPLRAVLDILLPHQIFQLPEKTPTSVQSS